MNPLSRDCNAELIPSSEESQAELTPKAIPHRMFAEYEEIYNAQERQLQNLSLDSYPSTNPFSTINTRNYGRDYDFDREQAAAAHQFQPKSMPPRPRSADFLEYESKKQFRKMNFAAMDPFKTRGMPARPKSSLDINSAIDNYYYSEASYAAKMRQSAMYLQNRNLIRPPRGKFCCDCDFHTYPFVLI